MAAPLFLEILKRKNRRVVPPDAFLLAEGISLAGFP